MKEKFIIRTANEAYCFKPSDIVCIEADGNYCNLTLINKKKYLLSFQLGHIESMIKEQFSYSNYSFIRVGKSLIINIDELVSINLSKQSLELNQCLGDNLKFNPSREALKKLMNYLVDAKNNGIVRTINGYRHKITKMSESKISVPEQLDNDDIRIICE